MARAEVATVTAHQAVNVPKRITKYCEQGYAQHCRRTTCRRRRPRRRRGYYCCIFGAENVRSDYLIAAAAENTTEEDFEVVSDSVGIVGIAFTIRLG